MCRWLYGQCVAASGGFAGGAFGGVLMAVCTFDSKEAGGCRGHGAVSSFLAGTATGVFRPFGEVYGGGREASRKFFIQFHALQAVRNVLRIVRFAIRYAGIPAAKNVRRIRIVLERKPRGELRQ